MELQTSVILAFHRRGLNHFLFEVIRFLIHMKTEVLYPQIGLVFLFKNTKVKIIFHN